MICATLNSRRASGSSSSRKMRLHATSHQGLLRPLYAEPQDYPSKTVGAIRAMCYAVSTPFDLETTLALQSGHCAFFSIAKAVKRSGEEQAMTAIHAKVGDAVRFSKTVGESDIYLFAGLTGDLSPNHVDDEFMSHSIYGKRIAHGALMIGFMSTASTRMIDDSLRKGIDSTPVSLGYDGIRFLKPVYINDTVTVTYTISEVDVERRRTLAKVEVTNQRGELVAVGKHHLKWTLNAKEQPGSQRSA